MMNGPVLNELLNSSSNSLAAILASGRSDAEAVHELWWRCLSRAPSAAEAQAALRLFEGSDKKERLEDIAWSLLNSKEFLFR